MDTPEDKRKKRREAQRAKQQGMSNADFGADPEWKMAALSAVVAAARVLRHLTSDDVVERIPKGVDTPDWRALGPVMADAARAGVIVKSNMPSRNSIRRKVHAHPCTVWESLIYRRRAAVVE